LEHRRCHLGGLNVSTPIPDGRLPIESPPQHQLGGRHGLHQLPDRSPHPQGEGYHQAEVGDSAEEFFAVSSSGTPGSLSDKASSRSCTGVPGGRQQRHRNTLTGVGKALATIAQTLRGVAYLNIPDATQVSEALAYRENFSQREVMLIWPNFTAWDTSTDSAVEVPSAAYALGLRAAIDEAQGWHKTLSNVAVQGVTRSFVTVTSGTSCTSPKPSPA